MTRFDGFDEKIRRQSHQNSSKAIKKIDDSTCEIKRLYVKPEHRGKGYSRQMLNAALQRAQKLGFTTATLTTRPAVMPVAFQLYTRSGFENLGEENGVVRMRKIIA